MKKTLHFVAIATAFSCFSSSAFAQDPPVVDPQDAARSVQDTSQAPSLDGLPPSLQVDPNAITPNADRPEMGVMLGQSAGAGVLITDVRPGGAAYNAGLRRGDYILKVGEQQVSDPDTVADILAQEVADDRVSLVIWRDARRQDWTVDFRNTGPVTEMRADDRARQNNAYYGQYDRRYDTRRRYYDSDYYRRDRYYSDPYYRFGYYNDPYYGGYSSRYYNNRYSTGYRGINNAYPYYGNGIYFNGRGGGLRIGGFGIDW